MITLKIGNTKRTFTDLNKALSVYNAQKRGVYVELIVNGVVQCYRGNKQGV